MCLNVKEGLVAQPPLLRPATGVPCDDVGAEERRWVEGVGQGAACGGAVQDRFRLLALRGLRGMDVDALAALDRLVADAVAGVDRVFAALAEEAVAPGWPSIALGPLSPISTS